MVEKLALPTITLLSPVSPIAWLPVAIFVFGIGNAPAIFMVVVALFFHMVLATISQIDGVNRNLINVGAHHGRLEAADLLARDHSGDPARPADGPAPQFVRCLDGGAGRGIDRRRLRAGQVIMLARNTFNPSLVFFTIALIGLLGFCSDWLMRLLQKKILYWVPETTGVLRGL